MDMLILYLVAFSFIWIFIAPLLAYFYVKYFDKDEKIKLKRLNSFF
jgi:hypothetical protein